MKIFSLPGIAGMLLCATMSCTPKPYMKVMVRPASCSHDVQFAECASLGHLLQFAELMHKPVFLYFCAPWIEACKRMDQYVFTQDEMASYYNTHFINYKIDAGGAYPGPELADRYGITRFPTLLYLDGKGKIIKRLEGPATAAQLLEIGYYLNDELEKEMVTMGAR